VQFHSSAQLAAAELRRSPATSESAMGVRSFQRGLRERFADREALTPEEAYHRFWAPADLPEGEVLDLLRKIGLLFGIAPGLLRPDDPMERLTSPVPARAWWRDHFHDLIGGEAASELAEEFRDHLHRSGRRVPDDPIRTIDELVRLWCGHSAAEPVAAPDTRP
jgi:hypothetical protein